MHSARGENECATFKQKDGLTAANPWRICGAAVYGKRAELSDQSEWYLRLSIVAEARVIMTV